MPRFMKIVCSNTQFILMRVEAARLSTLFRPLIAESANDMEVIVVVEVPYEYAIVKKISDWGYLTTLIHIPAVQSTNWIWNLSRLNPQRIIEHLRVAYYLQFEFLVSLTVEYIFSVFHTDPEWQVLVEVVLTPPTVPAEHVISEAVDQPMDPPTDAATDPHSEHTSDAESDPLSDNESDLLSDNEPDPPSVPESQLSLNSASLPASDEHMDPPMDVDSELDYSADDVKSGSGQPIDATSIGLMESASDILVDIASLFETDAASNQFLPVDSKMEQAPELKMQPEIELATNSSSTHTAADPAADVAKECVSEAASDIVTFSAAGDSEANPATNSPKDS